MVMKQYIDALKRRASRAIHRTRRDWALPFLNDFDADTRAAREDLAPMHEKYVTDVSTPEMAASLEVSVLLDHLCRATRPKAILDLGSGFSSFVLRRYAQQIADVTVFSVDDHGGWLGKTETYLNDHDLPTDHLVELDEFDFEAHHGGVDLVFHDLGSMEVRKETLPAVLETPRSDGLIVLDDFHKGHYRQYVHSTLAGVTYDLYELRDLTEDEFGRFAALARPA
jgi:predicted O-methyltransferase YrrM